MLEMIVVMGIFALVGGTALFVSMETFHGSNFRSDRNLLAAALQHARAQSMNNMCLGAGCADGKPHGVKILPDNSIVLFQGASYATRDASVDSVFHLNIAAATGANEIVFSQLSGASVATTVSVTDQAGHVSTMTISSEGRIAWTH